MKYITFIIICPIIIMVCLQVIAPKKTPLLLEAPHSIGLYTSQPNHLLEIRDSSGNYFGLDVRGDSLVSSGTLKPDSAAAIFFRNFKNFSR